MKCPHCITEFHDEWSTQWLAWPTQSTSLEHPSGYNWLVMTTRCPACKHPTINLATRHGNDIASRLQVWPKGIARAALPPEVPKKYADDHREACLVLTDSPKASAALSRRCLQLLLRDEAGVKPGKLYAEIKEALDSGKFPSYVSDTLAHSVRHFGNFAAHAEKDVNTGEIIEVEPGEAEWCLDILETLFDFFFVQPAKSAARVSSLEAKLKDAGKRPTT